MPYMLYLVDPASSHMLVSKIKPCMSKFTPLYGETANGSLNQLLFLRSYHTTWITAVILELIHANMLWLYCWGGFIRSKPTGLHGLWVWWLWITNLIAWPCVGDASSKYLTYHLSMVSDMLTMEITGNGESVFDSGEGALETATTSKEGSRRANYPLSARGGSDEK